MQVQSLLAVTATPVFLSSGTGNISGAEASLILWLRERIWSFCQTLTSFLLLQLFKIILIPPPFSVILTPPFSVSIENLLLLKTQPIVVWPLSGEEQLFDFSWQSHFSPAHHQKNWCEQHGKKYYHVGLLVLLLLFIIIIIYYYYYYLLLLAIIDFHK